MAEMIVGLVWARFSVARGEVDDVSHAAHLGDLSQVLDESLHSYVGPPPGEEHRSRSISRSSVMEFQHVATGLLTSPLFSSLFRYGG